MITRVASGGTFMTAAARTSELQGHLWRNSWVTGTATMSRRRATPGGTVTVPLPTGVTGIVGKPASVGLGSVTVTAYGITWTFTERLIRWTRPAASFDSFVGSGDQYAISLGGQYWQYQYNYTTNKGLFYAVGPNVGHVRFHVYAYGPGQWYHGESLAFGRSGWSLGEFIADGARHNISQPGGDQWYFSYLEGVGSYYRNSTSGARFTFNYGDGVSEASWLHVNLALDSAVIAEGFASVGYVPDFSFADGGLLAYTPTTGWNYSYDYGTDRGAWANGHRDGQVLRMAISSGSGTTMITSEGSAPSGLRGWILPSSATGSGERGQHLPRKLVVVHVVFHISIRE